MIGFDPYGQRAPDPDVALRVTRVFQGQPASVDLVVTLPDGSPADDANALLTFTLCVDHDLDARLMVASWDDGITETPSSQPGAVSIAVPAALTERLGEGSYSWALVIEDLGGRAKVETGWLIVDYCPGAPDPAPPYEFDEPTTV